MHRASWSHTPSMYACPAHTANSESCRSVLSKACVAVCQGERIRPGQPCQGSRDQGSCTTQCRTLSGRSHVTNHPKSDKDRHARVWCLNVCPSCVPGVRKKAVLLTGGHASVTALCDVTALCQSRVTVLCHSAQRAGRCIHCKLREAVITL